LGGREGGRGKKGSEDPSRVGGMNMTHAYADIRTRDTHLFFKISLGYLGNAQKYGEDFSLVERK
jgi:hypothetical protein